MSQRGAGYDRHITIFSPDGRLFQIEYAFKAVKSANLTSVGVRGKNCVVLAGQKKVQDRLVDPSSVTNIRKISPEIGMICTGLSADAVKQVERARQEASEFLFENGYKCPVGVLSGRLADINQVYTQHAAMRAMGVMMIIGGVDEEKGPQLFRVDPAGHCWGYHACAAGPKMEAAQNFFEKQQKKEPMGEMDVNDTLDCAIMSLQTVLAVDFKPTDVEVGIVEGDGKFRKLTEAEIDERLTAIAERD